MAYLVVKPNSGDREVSSQVADYRIECKRNLKLFVCKERKLFATTSLLYCE